MLSRQAWTWKVRLSTQDGQSILSTVRAYWSPAHEKTREYIADCAAAMKAAQLKTMCFPTSAPELVDP